MRAAMLSGVKVSLLPSTQSDTCLTRYVALAVPVVCVLCVCVEVLHGVEVLHDVEVRALDYPS
jgi:hypothetical protein